MKVLMIILLVGCAHGPITTSVQGPNGDSHLTSCRNNIATCYNEARRVCGGKYTIEDSSNKSFHQVLPNGGFPVVLTHVTYSMLYSCK